MGTNEPDKGAIRMSDTTDTTTPETPATAPAATPEAPAATPSAVKPVGPDGFPEKTPTADMTPEQSLAYWQHKARKHEDAAKANADKAKRFDEFEESQKTEQQKLTDKLAAAEKRATDLEIAKIRAEVAADKGIPASLLSGSSLEEFEASADALLAFRGEKPKPDFGGGDKGEDVGSKAAQLSLQEVQRLGREGRHEEIETARAEGRLKDLQGIKTT